LSESISGEANYGIKPGFTEAFIFDIDTRNKLINEDQKSIEIVHPILRGRDMKPWFSTSTDSFMICTFPALKINIDDYPGVKNHLLSFGKERLEQSGNVGSRKKTANKWFETQDAILYYEDFYKPKIMYQKFQVKPCFIYDEQGLYCNDSMWIIPTENKALLGVLNSKMGWWLITKYCTQIQNGCQLIWKYFGQIPVPELDSDELTVLVEKMIELTQKQQTITNNFIKYLNAKFAFNELSRKLQNWHELEFYDFLKELQKSINITNKERINKGLQPLVELSLSQEAEWMNYFNEQKEKAQTIKSEIEKTDREIDQMVYELYGLTGDEIKIVENV
jgi:hypothetical protein